MKIKQKIFFVVFLSMWAIFGMLSTESRANAASDSYLKIYETEVTPSEKQINVPATSGEIGTDDNPWQQQLTTIKLTTSQNPKYSGILDKSLKIDDVQLIENNGKKILFFTGKAKPKTIFNLYIFSNDPIIITMQADESGNWSYRLDKDLPDGNHEAFVAITNMNGDIVSKGSPIAFIKTAQAANILAKASADQSPMHQLRSQYIFIALIIVFIFLLLALIIVGILTYKRKYERNH